MKCHQQFQQQFHHQLCNMNCQKILKPEVKMEYKTLSSQISKKADFNYEIAGFGSVFSEIDLHKDIVDPKAFDASLKKWKMQKKLPWMLFEHKFTALVGKWTNMEINEKGLWISGNIFPLLPYGRKSISMIATEQLLGLSIGFEVKESVMLENKVRKILKAELYEVSLVQNPANLKAQIKQFNQRRS